MPIFQPHVFLPALCVVLFVMAVLGFVVALLAAADAEGRGGSWVLRGLLFTMVVAALFLIAVVHTVRVW